MIAYVIFFGGGVLAEEQVRIAILGCGYVANMYRLTLGMHPELVLAGVFDVERSRSENMAHLTGARAYKSFEALVADKSVQIVLNLTNPAVHYKTTRALLEAGKHVYSEKPLAMSIQDAQALVDLAEAKGLLLTSAPCTLLNRVAQTVWKAVREQTIGPVRLVHAEMEDGMVAKAPFAKWVNEAGVAWPAVDEFETGCTVEHAGYVLSWLCAMFGPAKLLSAHSVELVPNKIPSMKIRPSPDYSVATIEFASGVVARMTNGIYAPHNHRLSFFGDDGMITVEDPRSDTSQIRMRSYHTLRRRRFLSPLSRRVPLIGGSERITRYRGSQTRDFCRSLADMAYAVNHGEQLYLDARFSLHVTELTLACHFANGSGAASAGISAMPYTPVTTFEPIGPMPWAA